MKYNIGYTDYYKIPSIVPVLYSRSLYLSTLYVVLLEQVLLTSIADYLNAH